MGLDNGLRIMPKTLKASRFLEKNFGSLKDEYTANTYEFGYWRKCWNIRSAVLEAFGDKEHNSDDEDIDLTISDLVTFRDIMKHFLIEENWYQGGRGSIWTWEQSIRGIANTIYWITEFLQYVEDGSDDDELYEDFTDEDFDIYFYDSY